MILYRKHQEGKKFKNTFSASELAVSLGYPENTAGQKMNGNILFKKGGSVKADMNCGEVRRSNREGKKIMKKYCINGKEKLVHAGAKEYTHEGKPSKSDTAAQKKRRANFKARHNCKDAKPGTAKHLACTELWEKGGKLNKHGVENNLWNNIRANKGSGKKPTKEMLEQEKKIKKQSKENGGKFTFKKEETPIKQMGEDISQIIQNNKPEHLQTLDKLKNIHKQNMDKDFVRRIVNLDPNFNIKLGRGEYATHKMSGAEITDKEGKVKHIAFPEVVNQNGKLIWLKRTKKDPWKAVDYAVKNNEYISFDTPEEASWYGQNYKRGWGADHEPRLMKKQGGILNQGNKPKEFILTKTSTDHTLDGYKLVNGKLVKDNTESVKGYLKALNASKLETESKEYKQYGKNLYSKLNSGGFFKAIYLKNGRPINPPIFGDVFSQYTKSSFRSPVTGQILIPENHPSFQQFVEQGMRSGYETYIGVDGKIYSHDKKYLDKNKDKVKEYLGTYNLISLPEVEITDKKITPQQVEEQIKYIKKNPETGNYAIVNKKENMIYYFDKNNKELSREPIITGQNNTDRDYSISMREWFELDENKGKTHEDYFTYLGEQESRVTPSGRFKISYFDKNILENPAKWYTTMIINPLKDLISPAKDEHGKEISRNDLNRKHRERDYGLQNKLLKLVDDQGVFSSKAIHGTNNIVRNKAFELNGEPSTRDLSNGCINVNGTSKCFEYLDRGSSVYILPEEEENIVSKGERINNANQLKKAKVKIYNSLKKQGIDVEEDALNFLTSVYGKESRYGTDLTIPYEDQLPIFKSQGDFQINPKTFKNYLPPDYKNTFDNQTRAVYNFYVKNKNKTKNNPVLLYNLYNSGRLNGSDKGAIRLFKAIYNRVSSVK